MKRYLHYSGIAVIAMLSVLCFYQAILGSRALRAAAEFVDMALASELQAKEASTILANQKDEETYQSVFMAIENNVYLKNETNGKSAVVDKIAIVGTGSLLTKQNIHLNEEDKTGCLISADIAETLFGNTNVSEVEIMMNNHLYEVRGVVHDLKETVMVTADNETQMTRLRVRIPEEKTAAQIQSAVMNQYGISGTILEYQLLYWLGAGSLWLFPVIASIRFLFWLLANAKSTTRKMERILWWGSSLLLIGVCGYFMMELIRIPRELVPTKWSDFSFWTRLGQEKLEALRYLFAIKKLPFEGFYISSFIQVLLLSVISLVLYFLAIICYTNERLKSS